MRKLLPAITALAALVCAGTSCQKESWENASFTVTATIADGQKTRMSYVDEGLKPQWATNDLIIGFDNATPTPNTYAYTVTAVDENGKATLELVTTGGNEGTATENPAPGTKMYMFFAPGKTPGDIDTDDKSLSFDLASQSADVVPALMMSEATVSENSLALNFTNVTAVIGIKTPQMAATGATYENITLSTAGINTQVKFDLSGEGGVLKANYINPTSATAVTKTVNFTGATPPSVIYLVSCPIETLSDLTFTATPASGNPEVFTRSGKVLHASTYYYINSPAFGTQRTITATLANLAGASTQPSLVNGKKVKVANGTGEPQECVLTVGASGASFVTSLTGDLTVVYPAEAAKVSGNDIDDVIIPTLQSATTLDDAIIAKATVDADANAADFTVQTAIFEITPGSGTNTRYVEVATPAGHNIANTESTGYSGLNRIHVASTTAAPVYVAALAPGNEGITFSDGILTCQKDGALSTDMDINCFYQINSGWTAPDRTITITFDAATRAIFESTLTSTILNNAEVKVANGTDAPVTCSISADGTTATITTNLIGDLTLVYPADAAKMNSTNDKQIDGVLVSTSQDGTLAGALKAMATVAADASTAEFSNQTAVFKITPPATGTTKVDVLATVDIANDDTVIPANYKKIHVDYAPATTDYYYVSILVPSSLKLGDLSFDNGGFAKKITTGVVPITVNNLYEINSSDWGSSSAETGQLPELTGTEWD